MTKCFVLALCLSLAACASNQEKFSDEVEFKPIDNQGEVVKAKQQTGKSGPVEWFSCEQAPSAAYFVLLSPSAEGFSKDQACTNPLSQAFLSEKYNVLLLNRPGQGHSEGRDLLGDDTSLAALDQAVQAFAKSGAIVGGLWAFEEASVVGFRLAKAFPYMYLLVGNGIYDWDATLQESTDKSYVESLRKLQEGQGASFAELRSIAWDFSGLPKTIALYHGSSNPRFPEAPASRFRTALAANEFKVDLMLLKEENAQLTPQVHQSVIQRLLQALKPKS